MDELSLFKEKLGLESAEDSSDEFLLVSDGSSSWGDLEDSVPGATSSELVSPSLLAGAQGVNPICSMDQQPRDASEVLQQAQTLQSSETWDEDSSWSDLGDSVPGTSAAASQSSHTSLNLDSQQATMPAEARGHSCDQHTRASSTPLPTHSPGALQITLIPESETSDEDSTSSHLACTACRKWNVESGASPTLQGSLRGLRPPGERVPQEREFLDPSLFEKITVGDPLPSEMPHQTWTSETSKDVAEDSSEDKLSEGDSPSTDSISGSVFREMESSDLNLKLDSDQSRPPAEDKGQEAQRSCLPDSPPNSPEDTPEDSPDLGSTDPDSETETPEASATPFVMPLRYWLSSNRGTLLNTHLPLNKNGMIRSPYFPEGPLMFYRKRADQ